MPYAGSPSQVDSAGHPQGVALRETRLHRRHERIVYRSATPCGWPAWRSHGLQLTPKGVALLGVNLRPPQATRKGWPYERRGSTGGTNASSIVGPPLAGGLPGARTAFS